MSPFADGPALISRADPAIPAHAPPELTIQPIRLSAAGSGLFFWLFPVFLTWLVHRKLLEALSEATFKAYVVALMISGMAKIGKFGEG